MHALLSPSSASRWLACPPSARLESQFPDNSGAAASEGTLAHALGELLLRYKIGEIKYVPFKRELEKIQSNSQYEAAMLDYMEDYATYVLEQYNGAKSHTIDALLFLEQKLDMSKFVPEGFGTGDVVIIANGTLSFIDLKYGKGVPVSATENKQMMLYALGALEEFGILFDIHTVSMTIYQPRLDSISTFEMLTDDLMDWAALILKPAAEQAFKGTGEFAPGEHCRFCKAKGACKANANFNLQLAKHDFKEGVLLSDADIADILDKSDLFTKWIAAVEEYALKSAVNDGKKWPGYKLVEGRSNRIYTDQEEVVKAVHKLGFNKEQIYTQKLIGLTDMEKLLTKHVFKETLGDYIIKPPGKPTLAPSFDKRPELQSADSAKLDFAEILDN